MSGCVNVLCWIDIESFFRPFDYSELSNQLDYLGFVTWHIIPLDAALRGVHSGKKWMDMITNNTQTGHHL